MQPILNIAAYKFLPLHDLKDRQQQLTTLCANLHLKGFIVLSPEGINLFVAGEADRVELLLTALRSWPGLADLRPRVGGTERQPFRHMLVRVKQELIAFGADGIELSRQPALKLSPTQLLHWLEKGRELTLLDVRNKHEVAHGSFGRALSLPIGHFHEFPVAAGDLPLALKEQPVVVVCTSGMRSEKAAALLAHRGFQHVSVLDGGILGYFEECGRAHYEGECFVFDQRVGARPDMQPARSIQCCNCRLPLSPVDQEHEHYQPGKSCSYCFKVSAEQMYATLARRSEQISKIVVPQPGSLPRDHFRPINIPAECDGQRLLDALCRIVTHAPVRFWLDRCASGLLLDADGQSCASDKIVRAGERYRHKFPAVIEPDVNMQIELLHEDEALLVVNKPAPLPMHAGGRFHRNTLKYVLDRLYHPQKVRPSHRIDANTTGAVVVARSQYVARKIQMQFARGQVDKVYLVRVQGHPATDEFSCDAPISAVAGELGSRSIDHEAGMPSHTGFRVRRRMADGTALLEARPLTGRTNQIRVHLWHLGFPVCGDPAYLTANTLGDSQTLHVNSPPLCLHAWQISFEHPVHREAVTFTAPPPDWANTASAESSAVNGR